jgi:hypothetical protein
MKKVLLVLAMVAALISCTPEEQVIGVEQDISQVLRGDIPNYKMVRGGHDFDRECPYIWSFYEGIRSGELKDLTRISKYEPNGGGGCEFITNTVEYTFTVDGYILTIGDVTYMFEQIQADIFTLTQFGDGVEDIKYYFKPITQ